ncbi:MAG: DUF4062 domain-containing protein, partial [Planctomycetaceae bacterium]|nr:DUF4062 domain-containing protein [Planctomycetaceae bacterium]
MSQTLFLSTVSNEFGSLRSRLAKLLQRTKRVHVRHQDDFFHHGVKTLRMLEEEIERSDVVIHVIGEEPGWCPPVDQVEDFLHRHPQFAVRFPELVDLAKTGTISATQWEFWLALFFNIPRILPYEFPDRLQPGSPQQQHSQRLHDTHHHPRPVSSVDALYDEIIGSLLGLGLLTEHDLHRPIQLPYQSIGTLFKGRESFLDQLRTSLRHTGNGKATAVTGKAVHGLGGVGKTRLAVEYAWQHAEEYSAVLFVTADSPQNLRRNLAELVGPMVLDLEEQAATEEDVRVAAALRWLADHPGWFLILDNVDCEAAAECVEQLLPKLQRGHVLITSRLGRWHGQVHPLELDVLDTAQAAAFLLQRTERQGNRGRKITAEDEAEAQALAGDLDGLALALEQAGAYIVARRKSLAEYRELWRQHDQQVQTWHVEREMKYP